MKETKSISTCAMLVNLRLSVWTARKKDKQTEAEVRRDKNAQSVRAASVHKHLLADAEPLLAVGRFAADCRNWLYANTLAWGDNGDRLLPTAKFFTFKQEAATREQHFWQLVHRFERDYPTLITSMALQLGQLFNRNEYPDPRDIVSKFGFHVGFTPVPQKGDFRVDVPADALRELQEQCATDVTQKVEASMREAWNRLHEAIVHIRDKLVPSEDGKTKRIHESTVVGIGELCASLTALNIMDDPKLEEARKKLENAFAGVSAESLREVEEVRESVKTKMDDILSKFNF